MESCSELENPIGIETSAASPQPVSSALGCSELENPIGIETWEFPGETE